MKLLVEARVVKFMRTNRNYQDSESIIDLSISWNVLCQISGESMHRSVKALVIGYIDTGCPGSVCSSCHAVRW